MHIRDTLHVPSSDSASTEFSQGDELAKLVPVHADFLVIALGSPDRGDWEAFNFFGTSDPFPWRFQVLVLVLDVLRLVSNFGMCLILAKITTVACFFVLYPKSQVLLRVCQQLSTVSFDFYATLLPSLPDTRCSCVSFSLSILLHIYIYMYIYIYISLVYL